MDDQTDDQTPAEKPKAAIEVDDVTGGEQPVRVGVADSEPNPTDADEVDRPERLLPLRETVVFPGVIAPVLVGRPKSKALVEDLFASEGDDKMLLVASMKDASVDAPSSDDIYDVGTLVRVIQMLRLPDGSLKLVIEGVERRKIVGYIQEEPFFVAVSNELPSTGAESAEAEATLRSVLATFQRMVELAPYLPEQLVVAAMNVPDPAALSDFLASNVNIDIARRQELLEMTDVAERLEEILRILTRETELLEMGSKINAQIQGELDDQQREFMLRRQLEAIKKELGDDDGLSDFARLRSDLEAKDLPEEVRTETFRELDRLESIPTMSPEHSVIRTYLEWMLELPWGEFTDDHFDMAAAAKQLDDDHYGLERPKDRILEFLAVHEFKPDVKGPILAFIGPPGVGKTSLGESIADAMGRRFVRMSLGGIHDEAELRGHRRTYVGALPGRIVTALRRAGSMNPVIMLDEVDKLGSDFRGDPSAALLEILDPAQNDSFRDHYLGIPIDLSHVLFIATANIADAIPRPLLDRMELIDIPGYTEPEKREIARRHLIPRQLEAHGLDDGRVEIDDDAIDEVISAYTREAGVRTLERQLAALIRKAARKIVEGAATPIVIDAEWASEALGPQRREHDLASETDEIGLATGLAWTPAGGDVLSVEASIVPGTGKLTLTGQLGDVMQESARAALTYIRTRAVGWGIDEDWAEHHDIHIHVPAGAIPKDGPSAGVTMATALASALTQRRVSRRVGMTGEITLRGHVLPIGGLKEKLLAAHRAGLRTVVIPDRNEKDLVDIPEFVRDEIDIIAVDDVDQVLAAALLPRVDDDDGAADS